jgi:hypothetical protein
MPVAIQQSINLLIFASRGVSLILNDKNDVREDGRGGARLPRHGGCRAKAAMAGRAAT